MPSGIVCLLSGLAFHKVTDAEPARGVGRELPLCAALPAHRIKEDAESDGVRVTLDGKLGTAKLGVQVDVGFGDAVTPEPEVIEFPTLLTGPAPSSGHIHEKPSPKPDARQLALDLCDDSLDDDEPAPRPWAWLLRHVFLQVVSRLRPLRRRDALGRGRVCDGAA